MFEFELAGVVLLFLIWLKQDGGSESRIILWDIFLELQKIRKALEKKDSAEK